MRKNFRASQPYTPRKFIPCCKSEVILCFPRRLMLYMPWASGGRKLVNYGNVCWWGRHSASNLGLARFWASRSWQVFAPPLQSVPTTLTLHPRWLLWDIIASRSGWAWVAAFGLRCRFHKNIDTYFRTSSVKLPYPLLVRRTVRIALGSRHILPLQSGSLDYDSRKKKRFNIVQLILSRVGTTALHFHPDTRILSIVIRGLHAPLSKV